MTRERFLEEKMILENYLPKNMFRFGGLDTNFPYLQAGVITNDGTCYLLNIRFSGFPETKPRAYVEEILRTKSGEEMSFPSPTNHTLSSWNGWTQLCHYNDQCWKPEVSLWKVYLKCRLWLEMYRAHLRTGKTIEYYLNHQKK